MPGYADEVRERGQISWVDEEKILPWAIGEAKKIEGSGYGYGDRLIHKTVIHDRDARFYRNLSRVLQVDICCCRGLLLKNYYVAVALAGDLVSDHWDQLDEEKRDLGRKEGRGRSTLSVNQKADGNWLLILLCLIQSQLVPGSTEPC